MHSQEQGVILKLCSADIVEKRHVPKIKVCSKQKIVYKLGKEQTLRKPPIDSRSKSWRLQTVHPPHSKSLNLSMWTNSNQSIDEKSMFPLQPPNPADYRQISHSICDLTERYRKLGFSSMEWTRHETDLLLTLCTQFGNRWPLVVDRYNCCKPQHRPSRTIIQIKQRYYECRNLVLFYLKSTDSKDSKDSKSSESNGNHNGNRSGNEANTLHQLQNEKAFNYDPEREEKRRNELSKLLRRSHDDNMEMAQCAESYRKQNQMLKRRVTEMQRKRIELEKQSLFIIHRQEMSTEQIEAMRSEEVDPSDVLPFGSYQGFGTLIQDTFLKENKSGNPLGGVNEVDLPPQCIPTKVKRVRRHIQLIDDEYTKYKYELKLDAANGQKTTVVPFPYIDKEFAERNKYDYNASSTSKKRKGKQSEGQSVTPTAQTEQDLLSVDNPDLGKEIARRVQKELVKENIVHLDTYTGTPKLDIMTNTTRAMVGVLREDYIKYFALKTMVNDLKKKRAQTIKS